MGYGIRRYYSPKIKYGRAAQTADGHRTVNPTHRNSVGSNPTSPTKQCVDTCLKDVNINM